MSGVINSAGSKSGEIGTTELDYEEGEWTPIPNNTVSGPTDAFRGKYTKIGNQVHIQYNFSQIGYSSGSDALQISGLPFTALAGFDQYYTTGGTYLVDISSDAGHIYWFLNGGTKIMYWKESRDNNAASNMTVDRLSSVDGNGVGTSYVRGEFTYLTAE